MRANLNFFFFNIVLMGPINSAQDPLKKQKKNEIYSTRSQKKKEKKSQNANAEKQLYPNRYVASSGSLNP